MQDLSGKVIRGYELQEQIGVGGYGAVYRATQSVVGREVAIKIILPQYANHPDFIRRFEAEAHLVARLEHPHIVPLYDYWREPDSAYLVMRWLRGGSLHRQITGQPWPAGDVVPLLDQIAAALTIAHRHGVVHRDLKPANILLDEDGNAYLADFGIAKDLGSAFQTDHSGMIGSPAYISPEQVKAEPITPQTDIYSLGIMLYELLTGELPFEGSTPVAVLFKHIHEQTPRLQTRRPDLSDALNAVIQRATAKNPLQRYPDVLSLVADFRRALGSAAPPLERSMGTGTPATGPGGSGTGQRTSGARRTGSVYDTGLLYQTGLLDVVVPAVENPYKGLRAFQEADAADFFGREALTGRLLARLSEKSDLARFLAVVGSSGSGKSSVVRAGLLPALRRGALPGSRHWFIVEMIPSAHPLGELTTALLRVAVDQPTDLLEQLRQDDHGLLYAVQRLLPGGAETELVLMIDQFEEVFTLVEDETARTHFLNSLLVAVTDPRSRLRVIMTLRADFYDRPLLYPGLSELVRQRTEVVTPLTAEELQHAIVGPAERVGMILEQDLIGAILHDVGEQPGALPLLQYALTELFERRVGQVLTLDAYHATGGVLGALARRAEAIYTGLDSREQEAAQQLFLRLVTLGEGMEDTRRRVLRSDLDTAADDGRRTPDPGLPFDTLTNRRDEGEQRPTTNGRDGRHRSPFTGRQSSAMDAVIDAYGRYRLLTFDRDPVTREPTVEVAHEALIRTWKRLRDWLDANRDDLRLQRRLATAAAEWVNAGRDPSFLATGARLEQYATWADETHLALNADERAYLHASLAERGAQRAQEEARRAREARLEHRSRNILRALVGVFVVATVLALGLALVAFNQWQEARRNAAEAQEQRQNAEQQKQIAEQNAAQARIQAVSSGAQAALSQTNIDLALMLGMIANSMPQHSADSERILAEAAYAPGTRIRFLDNGGPVQSVVFSPDGTRFLVGSQSNTAVLWDIATGKPIRRFEGHTGQIQSVEFSPNGRQAITASEDATAILWDVETGQIIHRLVGHKQGEDVKQAVFSPDAKTALTASSDTTLILWDLATGKPLRTFIGHTQKVRAVAFSPDGTTALSGSADASIILWNVATGKPIRTFDPAHKVEVLSVAFSPDGKMALSGSADTSAVLWDVATGKLIHRFTGHTRDVWVVRFSPDGQVAVTGSLDNRAALWNVASGERIRFLTGHGAAVRSASFNPNRAVHTLLTGATDGTVRLWDLDNGAQIHQFNGHTDTVNTAAFSPDGRMILTGAADNTTHLWDAASGRELRLPTKLHNDAVRAVAFSPDGKTAISSSEDTTLILQEAPSGQFIRRFEGHTGAVNSVVFSPDGKTALSGAGGGEGVENPDYMILWDVATARPIRSFKGHKNSVASVAFSPDGSKAVSGSSDKTVMIWDIATGQPLHTMKGHEARVRVVAYSPDGKTVLSGSEDRTLILWNAETGERVRTFEGHNGSVFALAYNPKGKTFASGADDAVVLLWDIETGMILRRFEGHGAVIRGAAFSPDGRTIVSASGDNSVRLWRVDTVEELVAWTKANRYVPDLSCDQQKVYRLTDRPCVEPSATSTN